MINYLSKPFRWFFKLEAASGLILLIYLNFVKQSKDSPKGTNKQKFATFMKSFIPVGITTIFFVVFTAFFITPLIYPLSFF